MQMFTRNKLNIRNWKRELAWASLGSSGSYTNTMTRVRFKGEFPNILDLCHLIVDFKNFILIPSFKKFF